MSTNDDLARESERRVFEEWERLVFEGYGRELYDRMLRVGVDVAHYAGTLESAVLEAAEAYKAGHCVKARRIIMSAAKVAKARALNAEVDAVCRELDEEEAARIRALN
jgi:hypothetical protein